MAKEYQLDEPLGPQRGDARSQQRLPNRLKVKLDILIPEQTFTPKPLDARIVDLTEGGMQLRVPQLPFVLHNQMMRHTRLARVTLSHPRTGEPIKLTGRIVWMDFQKGAGNELGAPCSLGIFFSEKEGLDARYAEFVESLGPAGGAAAGGAAK